MRSTSLVGMFQDESGVGRVTSMLHAHSDRVNCVSWLRVDAVSSPASQNQLLSGAADNNVIIWKCVDETSAMVTSLTVTECNYCSCFYLSTNWMKF